MTGPSWRRWLNWVVAAIYVEALAGWLVAVGEQPEGPAFALWSLHFLRRALESVLEFRYSRTGVASRDTGFSWVSFLGAVCFYFGGGYLIGGDVHDTPFRVWRTLGVVVYLMGEGGNAYHHYLLSRNQRRALDLPRGGLFATVHKAHYFCEAVAWLGFALAFPSWSTVVWFVASLGGMYSQIYGREASEKKAAWWMIPGIV